MLKDKLEQLIAMESIELTEEEKEYVLHHHIPLKEKSIFILNNPIKLFPDAYIEHCQKETEEVVKVENSSFLNQSIDLLKKQKSVFTYFESDRLEIVGVDAISLELDDVFGLYDVMLGLKLQKKYDQSIRAFLKNNLQGDDTIFDLMFNREDGLWDLNFALNNVEGFKEDITFGEAYSLIYSFLFRLVEKVEETA